MSMILLLTFRFGVVALYSSAVLVNGAQIAAPACPSRHLVISSS